MKRFILINTLSLLAMFVSAQDFASRFFAALKSDTNLSCVTISTKMMEEILNNDEQKDEDVLQIIANLKSMQMLSSKVKGKYYYDDALKVMHKNSNRFEPFLSFSDKSENCQIMIRKKNDAIIELVMLIHENTHFTVINFTGTMSSEFISKLAGSMKQKHS